MDLLGGIGSILGGLFGGSGSTSSSFNATTHSTTNASSQDLSPELLKSLESLFQGQVGNAGSGGFGQATKAAGDRLTQLVQQSKQPEFDVSGFAKGVTDQAAASAGLDLESSINDMLSKSGITESGNSMGALLANKLRNQTAANLGGVAAQATATGEGIRQSQQQQVTEGINSTGSTILSSILQLIQSTRGADTTGTSTTDSKTTGSQNSKTKGGLLGLF